MFDFDQLNGHDLFKKGEFSTMFSRAKAQHVFINSQYFGKVQGQFVVPVLNTFSKSLTL
jgi:hypothetical protein